MKLTFRQWAICYTGALGFGGIAWWMTENPWIGGGVLVAFTAVYVFYLAGKVAPAQSKVSSAEGLTRQQKRALKRKKKQ